MFRALLLALLFAVPAVAQGRDEIETDRDSFTPAATTAGRKRFIVESAYSFLDNADSSTTHSFPELLLRYGLTDRFELRLGWNDERTFGAVAESEGVVDSFGGGEQTLAYGFKLGLTELDGRKPRYALIVQALTPTGGADVQTDVFVTVVVGWEVFGGWRLDASMRYAYVGEEGDHSNLWAPSAVLKVPLGEKVAVHAEYFGVFTTAAEDNTSAHYFSPGVHYLVTPNFEVGVRLGVGLSRDAADFFTNVGVGLRF